MGPVGDFLEKRHQNSNVLQLQLIPGFYPEISPAWPSPMYASKSPSFFFSCF